jgi:hypothetical protein
VVRTLPAFHVHYRVHSSRQRNFILSQINPVHALSPHFSQIQLNVPPSTPWSSDWSLTLTSPHHNPLCPSPLPLTATCPLHPIFLGLLTRLMLGDETRRDETRRDTLQSSGTLSVSAPSLSQHPLSVSTLSLSAPYSRTPSAYVRSSL